MKKLTIKQKAKAYDKAFERAKGLYAKGAPDSLYLEEMFPALKDNNDEKIRDEIILYIGAKNDISLNTHNRWLNWLEKQGKKHADNIEPKFKVGDWVMFNNKHQSIYQVDKIEDGYYILRHIHGGTFRVCVLHDKSLRLWTIADAKDGDVLCGYYMDNYPWIGIFHNLNADGSFSSYCFLQAGQHGNFCSPSGENIIGKRNIDNHTSKYVVPATKEQRDALMKAMTNAGYIFDFEKKELKKIEQKPTESRHKSKPNGAIVCEDFNDGDGYYKANLAYLNGSQIELIEHLVTSWQNSTYNTAKWREEDENIYKRLLEILCDCHAYGRCILKMDEYAVLKNWLESLYKQFKQL